MCERCTTIESAFGSRDPLPPRVASLDAETLDVHFFDSLVATNAPKDSAGGATVASPICPKWSEVAALGFKARQPSSPAAVPALRDPAPCSVLALIMKHMDLLDVLMLNCPDFPTLLALLYSCKTAKRVFDEHPQGIIKAVLRTMPQELQYLTVALIGINGCDIRTFDSTKKSMEIWLGKRPKPLSERLQTRPIEIVRKLARSFSAIELFMKVIPKNCENNLADYKTVLASRVGLDYDYVTDSSNEHPILQQTEWSLVPDDTEWDVPCLPPGVGPQAISLPLNGKEMYRLKRALLRYELFCAIFYLGPDDYYDKENRPHRFKPVPGFRGRQMFRDAQKVFFQKYVNPWEIGELAVVSHFMYDLVRNAYFHKYLNLRYRDACDSWYGGQFRNKNHGRNRHSDHEEVADEFDNFTVWFASQGLPLLKKIYVDRNLGYQTLVKKHCQPHYRAAELFIPIERCADRQWFDDSDPKDSWTPRHTWPDTLGMELPSKSWLVKGPTSDSTGYDDAYWGDKWMRKIGYYIWDRD